MKKIFVAALVLICMLGLVSCNQKNPQQLISKIDTEETYPAVPGTLEVIYKNMSELVADADMIVRIFVDTQSVEVLDGYSQVHTSITINDIYKGNLEVGDSIKIIEEAGQEGTVLGGIPVLNSDYEYILFLTEYNGNYYPCGAYQGRFILREGYLFQQATENVKLIDYSPMTVETFVKEIDLSAKNSAQTGQIQSAQLLSVDVKVIEIVNDTTFTVEALADCSDKIRTGDIISVTTDFEEVVVILRNYQESNHFKMYFPNVGKTDEGFSVNCFDVIQYDANGECLEMPDIEADTVSFHDKTFNKSDLSTETLEWLEHYNTLSPEEQLAISRIPNDLYELCGYGEMENAEVDGPTE